MQPNKALKAATNTLSLMWDEFTSGTGVVIVEHADWPGIDGEEACGVIRKGFGAFCNHETKNLLQAKRTLARAASEGEKYLF